MKTLIALDVATVTGWAFGPIDGTPLSNRIRFGGKSAPDDEVWADATKWFVDFVATSRPDVVALEAPIMTSSPAGGSNPHTQMRLLGLQAVLRQAVYLKFGRPARLVHVQSARKFFIGHGNKPGEEAKRLVKARCIQLGWLTEEDAGFDRSDALCVWAKAAGDISPTFAANLTPLGTAAPRAAEPALEF